jgi:hypothetical protein
VRWRPQLAGIDGATGAGGVAGGGSGQLVTRPLPLAGEDSALPPAPSPIKLAGGGRSPSPAPGEGWDGGRAFRGWLMQDCPGIRARCGPQSRETCDELSACAPG